MSADFFLGPWPGLHYGFFRFATWSQTFS